MIDLNFLSRSEVVPAVGFHHAVEDVVGFVPEELPTFLVEDVLGNGLLTPPVLAACCDKVGTEIAKRGERTGPSKYQW